LSALQCTLADLSEGASARICSLRFSGAQRQRMLDLGFIPGSKICVLQTAPLGDPTAYSIRGSVIALRKRDALLITVERK